MKPEKDTLKRTLRRLGHVTPGVLEAARERVRRNLKSGRRPIIAVPPLPDAAQPDLTALRRPFFLAGAAVALGVLIAFGTVFEWRSDARSASKRGSQSTSKQTPETRQDASKSLPSPVEEPAPLRPLPPKPEKRISAKADTHPATTEPPPIQLPSPQARFTLLPPGEGKVILDRACGGCHRAASVGASHFATRAEYAVVVSRMIGMGAPVSEQEADVLVDYLFDNLGIKPDRTVDTAGRAILDRACTTCHSLNGIEKYSYDSEDPYRELVSTMISYGATLSEGEKTTLVRYLFANYGKR